MDSDLPRLFNKGEAGSFGDVLNETQCYLRCRSAVVWPPFLQSFDSRSLCTLGLAMEVMDKVPRFFFSFLLIQATLASLPRSDSDSPSVSPSVSVVPFSA